MNWDILKGDWTQLKGKVRQKWSKLTDDDIELIGGKGQELLGRLQERYGMKRDQAEREVDTWFRTQNSQQDPQVKQDTKRTS